MQTPDNSASRLNSILSEREKVSRQLQESTVQQEEWKLQAELVSLHEQEQEVFRDITGSSECFNNSAFDIDTGTTAWLWHEKSEWAIALYRSGELKKFSVDPAILEEVEEAISVPDLKRVEQLIGGSGSFLAETR